MLSEKKMKVMIKLADYEQTYGKKDMEIGKYYKNDYVRFQILKSIISFSISYFLIVAMIVLYRFEYVVSNAVKLNYKTIGISVGIIYILLLLMYIVITIAIYSLKYEKTKKRLKRYFHMLKVLSKYYEGKNS